MVKKYHLFMIKPYKTMGFSHDSSAVSHGFPPGKTHLLRHPNAICQVQRHVLLRMLQRGRVVGPGTAPCAIRMGPPRYVCWLRPQ